MPQIETGELVGVTSATQLPNQVCKYVKFKAKADNTGTVYIGAGDITVADESTDTTSGFPLAAGEETGWIPCENLNQFFRLATAVGDACSYMAII